MSNNFHKFDRDINNKSLYLCNYFDFQQIKPNSPIDLDVILKKESKEIDEVLISWAWWES